MKAILSAAMAFLLACGVAFSQGYTFKVLANKGQNQIKRNGQLLPLRTGTSLVAGDEVISKDGSYIGLMHKSGKTLEIRSKGVTKVQDLEKKVSTGNSSVASRYASYISAKMNESEGGGSYRTRMKATGAVERATDKALMLAAPKDVDIYSDMITLRWIDSTGRANGYVVTFKNIFDEEIKSFETTESKLDVDMTDTDLSSAIDEGGVIIASIKAKNDASLESKEVGIKRVSEEDKAVIDGEVAALTSEVDMDSPLANLILASYYEDKGYKLDALTQYEAAISKSPEVTDFKDLYESFLVNNKLVKLGQ